MVRVLLCVTGYGPQGRGQALNLRDNKQKVIVGVRKGKSYDEAVADGFVPGKTLFDSIEEAAKHGTIIMYLLSDAAQKMEWNKIKPHLTKGMCLHTGYTVHCMGVLTYWTLCAVRHR